MRIAVIIILFLTLAFATQAQLSLKPIAHITQTKITGNENGRVQDVTPLQLPFWDDFSYYSKNKPIGSLWASSNTVSINDGMAINPVSLKVATFDGYDANGKPYDVSDNGLVKGFADSLVSLPIDLSVVPAEKQGTVYLSFYFQAQGNGEVPDASDKLSLYFKGPLGWESIEDIQDDGTLDPTAFYFRIIQVPFRFLSKAFQFKFKSFGRLSGPYDNWNLDYVYLNKNRDGSDSSTPDRTLANPMTSLFKDYWSIPYFHFKTNISENLLAPNFDIYNLKAGNDQPLNYFSYDEFIHYINKKEVKTSHRLDSSKSILPSLLGLDRRNVSLSKIPLASSFDPNADSVIVKLKIALTSGDNDPKPGTDYDIKYSPIDFRNNDTTTATLKLRNYYAYDDGTAEYAAGINQAGAELAYLFTMKTPDLDTITAIKIHFPNFNDQPNQVFELHIWRTISDTSPALLYKQTVSVSRKGNNQFTTYTLDPTQLVIVQGSFYVGWKQATSNRMDVGFDANTDSAEKIFYNTSGTWTKNIDLKGSLMIRPVFRNNKASTITAVNEPTVTPTIYPNPNKGTFNIPKETEQMSIYDTTGALVEFRLDDLYNEKKVEITRTGLFVVRLLMNGTWTSHRIVVN